MNGKSNLITIVLFRKNLQISSICLLVTLLFGCTYQREIYDWGSYDQSLEKIFNVEKREFLINDEIEIIARELAATRPERIPPGKTAHLGYLYALKGDVKSAQEFFKQEKVLFPESTVFMDELKKLISRTNKTSDSNP